MSTVCTVCIVYCVFVCVYCVWCVCMCCLYSVWCVSVLCIVCVPLSPQPAGRSKNTTAKSEVFTSSQWCGWRLLALCSRAAARYICQVFNCWHNLSLDLSPRHQPDNHLNMKTPSHPPPTSQVEINTRQWLSSDSHLKDQLSKAIETRMSLSPPQVSTFQVRRIRARNQSRPMLISPLGWVTEVSICQSHGERGKLFNFVQDRAWAG